MIGWPAVLESRDVRLRPLAARDAAAWSDARRRSSAWLAPWDATVPPGTSNSASSFRGLVRALRRGARQGRTLPFAVDVGGQFAGQVTVSNIVRGSAQFASIGYWIDQRYAGRGVIPRAVALAVDHCFNTVGLHRIEIAICPENTNSLRVVEKLEVREVGYAPRYLHINDEWRDHRLYGITAEECPRGLLARLDAPA